MDADLSAFNSGNEAMSTELVNRISRAVDLAQACADHAPENNEIIAQGRAALGEVAAFFEVDLTEPAR